MDNDACMEIGWWHYCKRPVTDEGQYRLDRSDEDFLTLHIKEAK